MVDTMHLLENSSSKAVQFATHSKFQRRRVTRELETHCMAIPSIEFTNQNGKQIRLAKSERDKLR